MFTIPVEAATQAEAVAEFERRRKAALQAQAEAARNPPIWYTSVEGSFGPFTIHQMRADRDSGHIRPDTHVKKGEDEQWVVAGDVPELFPQPLPDAAYVFGIFLGEAWYLLVILAFCLWGINYSFAEASSSFLGGLVSLSGTAWSLFGMKLAIESSIKQWQTDKRRRQMLEWRNTPEGRAYVKALDEIAAESEIRKKEEQRQREENERREAERQEREREAEYRQHLRNIRLPSYLQAMDPLAFEALACDLHARMGYEVETTSCSGDNGADGFLRKDGDLTILQAKRVQGYVGEPILRDLYGTMHSFHAEYGVVVTTGKVSRQARKWASNKPIRIIELEELSLLIRQYFPEDEVVPAEYVTPKDRSGLCPQCHRPLRIQKGRHGNFLGCSGYPSCRYARSLQRS